MTCVMVFDGEYDLRCREGLRSDLDRLANDPDVILDFTAVRYLDSTCLSELVRAHRLRREKGFPAETIVLGASEIVRKLLSITQLEGLFRVSESLDRAIEDAGGNASFQQSFATGEPWLL